MPCLQRAVRQRGAREPRALEVRAVQVDADEDQIAHLARRAGALTRTRLRETGQVEGGRGSRMPMQGRTSSRRRSCPLQSQSMHRPSLGSTLAQSTSTVSP